MLVALLGILAVVALAPQLASADTSTGAISGTVTNAGGQSVAGVTVGITNVTTGQYYTAGTASDGTYVVGGVPSGSYQVLFSPGARQNYVYQYYPNKSNAAAAQAVSVTSGQTTSHVDATLATGATLSGTVTAAAGGAPVSGVYVYVRDYGGGYPSHVYTTSTRTDSTGTWSLGALPTGTYQVQFSPSYPTTYASQYYNDVNGQDPPTPITITAGSTTSNIDAALITGGQISGTVTDGMTGAPAAGVFVSAVDASGNQWASSTTDSGGHYTLSALSA
jgi:5-hydroxyisourate hydrolase-like protein (transthyretin family)